MDDKNWLIEVEVAVCLAAMAMVAFTLMAGHHLWKRLSAESSFNPRKTG